MGDFFSERLHIRTNSLVSPSVHCLFVPLVNWSILGRF